MVEGESGEQCRLEPHVPTWGMVLEFVVKASTGHPSTPKGGSPEYRNGPWYKTIRGQKQGDRLGKKKKYGRGQEGVLCRFKGAFLLTAVFFAIVVSFENQRCLSESGTHH